MMNARLAYLASHPIQYQAPFLRMLAEEPWIDLKVFFRSTVSVRRHFDGGFGRRIKWDVDLLRGYDHEFLPSIDSGKVVSTIRPLNYGLSAKLRKNNIEALLIHGYSHWYSVIAIWRAKRMGIKILVRGESTDCSRERGSLRKWATRSYFKWLGKNVDCFMAIGALNRKYYLSQGIKASRIFMMPYAVDNKRFEIGRSEKARIAHRLRAQLRLSPQRPVILFVGKLIEDKRPQDLVEAFQRLSRDCVHDNPPYLVMVGEGRLRNSLERRVSLSNSQSVRFVGFVNQRALRDYYALASVLVLPSEKEPWGLVVNEAMNGRCAVILSDRVGCGPDLVEHGKNGFIFHVGNVGELASYLKVATSNRKRLEGMGAASFKKVAGWSYECDLKGLRAALVDR